MIAEELKREQQKREADTFASVAEIFIKRHVKSLRWARAVESTIRREMVARWGDKPIRDVTRRDVVEMLEEIVDGDSRGKKKKASRKPGGRYAARHAFAYASKLFNWAIARNQHGLEFSPCERIKLRDIVGRLTKLLLVTGQRLNDVARTSWPEMPLCPKPAYTSPIRVRRSQSPGSGVAWRSALAIPGVRATRVRRGTMSLAIPACSPIAAPMPSILM